MKIGKNAGEESIITNPCSVMVSDRLDMKISKFIMSLLVEQRFYHVVSCLEQTLQPSV